MAHARAGQATSSLRRASPPRLPLSTSKALLIGKGFSYPISGSMPPAATCCTGVSFFVDELEWLQASESSIDGFCDRVRTS